MKVYFLKPNSWDRHWTVLAGSPEEALEFMVKNMKEDLEKKREIYSKLDMWDEELESKDSDYGRFKDSTPDSLPEGYVLEEFGVGEVIEGEYA